MRPTLGWGGALLVLACAAGLPVHAQEPVEVREGDTPDSLADRVQAAERRIYPRAVALFAEGRLVREGGRVRVLARQPNKDE